VVAGAVQPRGQSRHAAAAHDLLPFSEFGEQARATLEVLREHLPFDRWMISRLVDDDLVVVFAEPDAGPMSFPWSDTICARMVEHGGPHIALSISDVPDYAAAPQCRALGIDAYAGVPLYDRAGVLWGTLAATHPSLLEPTPSIDEQLLRLVARSLGIHLDPSAPAPASPNRRSPGPSTILAPELWQAVVHKERERTARTGHATCIIEFDVSTTGDTSGDVDSAALLDRAAELVAVAARGCDFVGRTANTRLGLMAVNCPPESAKPLMDRLLAELEEFGIPASAVILDRLHGTERMIQKAPEPAGAITYMLCRECNRKGAYVSPRFPVLRCKYCGGRHTLSDDDWRTALLLGAMSAQ
jgi:diguanylate cyclase